MKEKYRNMQIHCYEQSSKTFDSCKNFCVGNWFDHEKYEYEKYLLENYTGKYDRALDFGCGMGRMIKRMLNFFEIVDGADLLSKNLEYSKQYLEGYNNRSNLYLTDGLSCNIENKSYDFIFSTICFQHICVHEIRFNIIKDLFNLLNDEGEMCIQMGYGYNNNINWLTNFYDSPSTNGDFDITIPTEKDFPIIKKDLEEIGFKTVNFSLKETPHKHFNNTHTKWLFIHCKKR